MEPVFGTLNLLDIAVIVLFFLVIFAISIYYSRNAGKDIQQFFLSGRNLPWYLAGTAMVATTFAADTPLAVTELVAKNGVAGNWLWWNMALGGLLTVFFFSKMWRRAGIVTDLEFVEFRYSGKEAAFLRGFRAIYLGVFMNAIVLGWVHKAMQKIFLITLPDLNPVLLVVVLAVVVAIYASASGLLGTIRTDSFQFIFALTGCIILAVIVLQLPEVGGAIALKNKLDPEVLQFFPKIGSTISSNLTGGVLALPLGAFIAFVGIQWWSSWYPGADPGGGGYVAQRMMSAKDEKNSLLATLWFNIAHFTLRPWPWIIVALAALVILPRENDISKIEQKNPILFEKVVEAKQNFSPELKKTLTAEYGVEFTEMYEVYENTVDPGVMYPKLMVRYLPSGILGLLIAVFMAAYMSTISSQLNWGTSYLINDFYKRFIVKNGDEKHYILISRIGIIVLVIFSLILSFFFMDNISDAWIFIINVSAGMGGVLILRWFWWRINAWTEIASMITPIIIYPICTQYFGMESPYTLYPIVIGTTIVWVTVALLTKPSDDKVLDNFYRKIHPGGPGWKKIALKHPDVIPDKSYGKAFQNWFLGIIALYACMYGTGKLIFHEYLPALIAVILVLICGYIIYYNLSKTEKQISNV